MNSLLYHLSQRSANTPTFKALSPCAKGPAVRHLQHALNRRLNALGVGDTMSVRVDGWFGNATVAAVKYLQCVAGLPVNGQVTARTQGFIEQGTAALEPLSLGSTGIGVLALKQVLTAETEIMVAHDGRFCQFTERAVMAYQRQLDLRCDGLVGAKTWEHVVRSRLGGLPCAVLLPHVHLAHASALN
ncbi:MAG: peptidoglycan-binding protein [Phormidesmis sp.]